jgi:hypothetical protein
VVCRSARTDGVPDFRPDALPVAARATVKITIPRDTAEHATHPAHNVCMSVT